MSFHRSGWRERYLSAGWNNVLVTVLGLLFVAYAAAVLSTSALSDRAAFIGMVLIGSIY